MRNVWWLLAVLALIAAAASRLRPPAPRGPVTPRPKSTPASPAPVSSAYNIDGMALGMTRLEVQRLGRRNCRVEFSSRTDKISLVEGTSLSRSSKQILRGTETAAQVREVLGSPSETSLGHVVATVGGFFWFYQDGPTISFMDDNLSLKDKAQIFEITLMDRDEISRDWASRQGH